MGDVVAVEEESAEEVVKRTRIEELMTSSVVVQCCSCQRSVVKEDNLCNHLECHCGNVICYGCGWQKSRIVNGVRKFHLKWPSCFRGTYEEEPTSVLFAKAAGERARLEMDKKQPDVRLVHDPLKNFAGIRKPSVVCRSNWLYAATVAMAGVTVAILVGSLYHHLKSAPAAADALGGCGGNGSLAAAGGDRTILRLMTESGLLSVRPKFGTVGSLFDETADIILMDFPF